MFKLKLLAVLTLATLGLATSVHAEEQSAAAAAAAEANSHASPPKPVENKIYDAMVGTWKGTSNMMGMKMNQTMKMHWTLGHQFLVLELHAINVDNPQIKYDGVGYFGVDGQGKPKSWWFDSWGADSASYGTGEFSENKLVLNDANQNFKETRSFEIQGKKLIMMSKGMMVWEGKEQSFDETTVYEKSVG